MKKIIYLAFAMLVLTSQAESKFWIGCNIGTDINKVTGTLNEETLNDDRRISKIQPTFISDLEINADFQMSKKWFFGGGAFVWITDSKKENR